jgi:hypothetical protein
VQEARASALFAPFVDSLAGRFELWNDSSVDPAFSPFALPHHNTVDGSIIDEWYSCAHVYAGIFVEALPDSSQLAAGSLAHAGPPRAPRDTERHAAVRSPQGSASVLGEPALPQPALAQPAERARAGAYWHPTCSPAAPASWQSLWSWAACIAAAQLPMQLEPTGAAHSAAVAWTVPEVAWPGGTHCRGAGAATCSGPAADASAAGAAAVSLKGTQPQGRSNPLMELTLMVNETAKHALPYALNAATNAALHTLRAPHARNSSIQVTLQPFPVVATEIRVRPLTTHCSAGLSALSLAPRATAAPCSGACHTCMQHMQAVVSRQLRNGALIMFTAMALSVLAASFIVIPVKERISGSLHVQVRPHEMPHRDLRTAGPGPPPCWCSSDVRCVLQMVSGLSPTALWLALLLVDMCVFCLPALAILASLAWASPDAFGVPHLPLLGAFMLAFGLASISQVCMPPASSTL